MRTIIIDTTTGATRADGKGYGINQFERAEFGLSFQQMDAIDALVGRGNWNAGMTNQPFITISDDSAAVMAYITAQGWRVKS